MAVNINPQVRNYQRLINDINAIKANTEKALKATVRDMASRAPGWIASEITNVYNIKKGEVTPKSSSAKGPQRKAVGVNVQGNTIDSQTITYSGTVLTPTHFRMTPKQRPKSTKDEHGKVKRKARPYEVSAEIKKGQRKVLGDEVFLGGNSGGGEIPFQRRGTARTPIDAIKTLSVPQMVTNEVVGPAIEEKLSEGMEQRFNHNIERFVGR